LTQAHILYSGTVQGVGFRYMVQRYALNLELTGWVKNLPNGSVEILVNGSEKNIEKLCQKIEGNFGANIKNKEIQRTTSTEEFEDFQITF